MTEFTSGTLTGKNLHLSFGHNHVLRGIDLHVEKGTTASVIGPSGSGKSTLLRVMNRLIEPDQGDILLDGRSVLKDNPDELRQRIGMVFQQFNLFPHKTVLDNVSLALRKLRKLSNDQARAEALEQLDLVGLKHKADARPANLSGGQQQRVAIARAIVIEPPLVLMDEPLSNLDAKLRIETRAEIRRIHKELGRSTIYVTHDQDEALSLADRIVVMKDGVVQQIAAPQEIYGQPANLHVARFMGYRNVLEVAVEAVADDHVTVFAPDIHLIGLMKQPLRNGRAFVAMRPEEVVLGEGPAGVNKISGRVDNVEYCGRDSLVDVVTASGTRLHVRSNAAPRLGDMVRVHVPIERTLVYPHE